MVKFSDNVLLQTFVLKSKGRNVLLQNTGYAINLISYTVHYIYHTHIHTHSLSLCEKNMKTSKANKLKIKL